MMIPIRPTDKEKLHFFCGDASREGFGGATQYPDGTLISPEGLWGLQFTEGGSISGKLGTKSIIFSTKFNWKA